MGIPVFLSYPKPAYRAQEAFVEQVRSYLGARGLEGRTLGVTDYDMDAPLTSIRRLMMESNGLLTIAFRRSYIERGTSRHGTDLPGASESPLDGRWITSPWSHIEPAMAYQLGLPVLILRENGVIDDGILERGVTGLYMPEFRLDDGPGDDYFTGAEWNGIMGKWEGYVRAVVESKGHPPSLY